MLLLLEGTAYSAGSRVNSRGIRPHRTGEIYPIWHLFPNLDKYVEALKEMAGAVRFDHVSIGTDQQVAPGSVQDYSQWVHLVAAMLAVQTAYIAESNYMRTFRTVPG